MSIKLHNTPTGKIEEFKPISENEVLIYSCGPTVYDNPHIGNWSSYIYWDILVRLFKYSGYNVKRVINLTDVGHLVSDADTGEDKLEKRSKRENKTAWDIAKYYTEVYLDDLKKLNLISPDYLPTATGYINEQIELIKKIHDKGATYQTSDGIYYDTSKFSHYADFAKLDLDNIMAGARVEFNPEKRNHSDFALWKFSPVNEKRDMEWVTPQDLLDIKTDHDVMGFPGWHIECSAMAIAILGETIDIHTGGIDHIPIHHTNEIAQSEIVTGKKFSNYWMHCNFLKVDGGKMSKSLGNVHTISSLQEKGYSPMDFKMLILQGNYRNEGNFTFDNLDSAKNRLRNWKNIATLRHQINSTLISDKDRNVDKDTLSVRALSMAVVEALENDLGTPEALRLIDETFNEIIKTNLSDINKSAFVETLENIDKLLGLKLIESTPDISDDLKSIIIERLNAREQKDWKRSDELRDELKKAGINVRDTDQSTSIWEYLN